MLRCKHCNREITLNSVGSYRHTDFPFLYCDMAGTNLHWAALMQKADYIKKFIECYSPLTDTQVIK